MRAAPSMSSIVSPSSRGGKCICVGNAETILLDQIGAPMELVERPAKPERDRGDYIDLRCEGSFVLTRRRRGRRKQSKLPHHSNIVSIREVLSDLAIAHPIHVDVLYFESATRGLYPHKHSAVDWNA